jgi:putative peptidoglycan lipid II flippase
MGMFGLIVNTYRFGQGSAMDAYNVAALVPITLAQMFASGLEAAVIPVYARVRARGKEQASKLFSSLLTLLIISLALFTIVMVIFRQPLILLSAPGLAKHVGVLSLATSLTPWIFPVLILMTLNSFMECLLNAEGKFGLPAYAAMAVPITIAFMVYFFGQSYGVLILCVATLLGQFLQLAFILYRAHQSKLVYRPGIAFRSPEIRKIARVAWPALFTSLIQQAGPFIDQIFASGQVIGSITAIAYANKLTSVPTGVIFSSVGKAALPYLSNQAILKDMDAFKGTVRLYTWVLGIGSVVLAAGMIVLAHPIVTILFQRGAFSSQDTNFTTAVLVGNLIGLPPTAVGFLLARAFSAMGKTRVLMGVTAFSVLANATLDYSLGRVWGAFGITLATSLVYYCTMIILIVGLRLSIGKLNLLTPPQELMGMMGKLGRGQLLGGSAIRRRSPMLPLSQYPQNGSKTQAVVPRSLPLRGYTNHPKRSSNFALNIPYAIRERVTRGTIIMLALAGAVVGATLSPTITLAVCAGATIILFLLRYQYALLIGWALISVFIGSSLPLFNGAHLLSGLILPTLLLLFYLPTKTAFKQMKALPCLLIFFLLMLPTAGMSPLTLTQFVTSWTTLLAFVGVGVLVVLLVTSRRRMLLLIDAILAPSIFIALYGIYGFFSKQNGFVDSATHFFRISSIFSNTPPTLAMFLTVIIPLAIYRTITLTGWKRLFGISIVILLLVTLGLTFTRGALISVPIALVVMILLLPSNKIKFGILGAIVAIGAVIVLVGTLGDVPLLQNVFSRFGNTDLASLNGRTYLWQAILDHYDPSYLLGYGHQASDQLLLNLRVGFGTGIIATASHNIFLEALYDHGIIGLTMLLLTFLVLGVGILRRMRNATYDHRLVIAAAAAVFTGVLIQCLESNDLWNQSVGIYFMIAVALPFARYWAEPPPPHLPVIHKELYQQITNKHAVVKPRATTADTVKI